MNIKHHKYFGILKKNRTFAAPKRPRTEVSLPKNGNMELQTKIEVKKLGNINHASNVMLLGSCFTEHISTQLEKLRFQTLTNPNGITYNPISIANTLNRLINGKSYCKEDLGCHDGIYYSPEHHGCFSSTSAEESFAKINKSFETASIFLRKTTHIIITFGSSVVYQHNGHIWNNCHKLPSKEFKTIRLSIEEIVEKFEPTINTLSDKNFVFTVSPVRYMNDREHSNSVNKATLLLAINELTRRCSNATYFPAYEIMMDELRDYRFYAEDMIHPSPLAVKIIFERFGKAFFTEETAKINETVEKVEAMRNHKPLHPESPEYEKFKQKLYENEENLNRLLAECLGNSNVCTGQR